MSLGEPQPENDMLALLLLSSPSDAFIYGGNPELHAHASLPNQDLDFGDAELQAVDLLPCGGGAPTHVSVDEHVDPVAGFDVEVPSGDWCAVVFVWDGAWTLESSEVEITINQAATSVDVSTAAGGTSPLSPFTVDSGFIYGGNPELTASID